MTEVELQIDGMSCQHCVMRVKKALDSLKGVISSDVAVGLAKVSFDEGVVQKEAIEKAITDAGYEISGK